LLPDGAAESARCMGLYAHSTYTSVSLNNACTRTVCKWFRRNIETMAT